MMKHVKKFLTKIFYNFRYRWRGDGAVLQRKYKTYNDYLLHQKSKLATLDLTRYDRKYRHALKQRLEENGISGGNVLCLAARIGTEVKAFHDVGCFAVGLDVNPGNENKYVVYGDFHDIQFPTGSVDIVFSNSLDHVLDFEKFVSEIDRVLKPGGILILEIWDGSDPGAWEVSTWKSTDDIIKVFLNRFDIVKKFSFRHIGKYAKMGTCVYLKKY